MSPQAPWQQDSRNGDSQGPPPGMNFDDRNTEDFPGRSFTLRNRFSTEDGGVATTTQASTTEEEGATSTTTPLDVEETEGGVTVTSPVRLLSTTVQISTNTLPPSDTSIPDSSPQSGPTLPAAMTSTHSGRSTLQTSTLPGATVVNSSDGTAASSVETTDAASNALPDLSSARRSGMSDGEVAAAVIMPIIAALAMFAALVLWRRRRRNRERPPRPFIPTMMEKINNNFSRHPSNKSNSTPAPILTSTTNNAYNTGLDQSSNNSGNAEYYAPGAAIRRSSSTNDPPPPYQSGKGAPQLPTITPIAEPEPVARSRSPFDDPVSPVPPGNDDEGVISPIEAAAVVGGVSRSPSISSTQYSDSASVHSARAARMSVGGPQMIFGGSPPRLGSSSRGHVTPMASRDGGGGVFDDPISPVSSLGSRDGERR